MFDKILFTLQNIWSIGLIRFVVFLVLAFVAAKVVSSLVTKLLKKLKLDEKLDEKLQKKLPAITKANWQLMPLHIDFQGARIIE